MIPRKCPRKTPIKAQCPSSKLISECILNVLNLSNKKKHQSMQVSYVLFSKVFIILIFDVIFIKFFFQCQRHWYKCCVLNECWVAISAFCGYYKSGSTGSAQFSSQHQGRKDCSFILIAKCIKSSPKPYGMSFTIIILFC